MVIKKSLRQLKAYKPGKPIEELKRSLRLKEVYKLASNENPFTPFYIKEAVLKETANINRYPEADCFYLRRELARKLKVKEEQLVFGNGSDEIIVMALRGFCNVGNNVVVGYPTFLIYELQAKVTGLKIKRVPFKSYHYDLDGMVKAIDKKTSIVFIANPDNPHGTYLSHREIEGFLSKIPKSVLVFFDEAYFEFAPKQSFPHSLDLLKKRGNIIVTRTFSKAYGLAGLRIGYAITTPSVAEVLNKIREPFNVNRFAQVAATVALKNKSFLRKTVSYINKEKDYFYRNFEKLGLEYVKSATNFILVNFKKDTQSLYEYLLKRGIIVRQLRGWGLRNYFRVTVGLHKENLAFMRYFKNYLKGGDGRSE